MILKQILKGVKSSCMLFPSAVFGTVYPVEFGMHRRNSMLPDAVMELEDDLQEKYRRLSSKISSFSSLLVAFSGGVDSTLLAYVAHRELGDQSLAVTAASETYPTEERRQAEKIAEEFGFNHRVVPTSELDLEGYAENNPDRCFICRDGLFEVLNQIARKADIEQIAYGENATDGAGMDYRPGEAAARKHEVHAPLSEADLGKKDVRTLSKALGLPNWDKPELACLSSRFPYGHEITEEKLRQVEKAEQFIKKQGFRQVRVRHHGEIARIEVVPNRLREITQPEVRTEIQNHLEELGYTYVTVDLRGYETGSLNRILDS